MTQKSVMQRKNGQLPFQKFVDNLSDHVDLVLSTFEIDKLCAKLICRRIAVSSTACVSFILLVDI
jgi:hypothetical protein